MHKSNIQILLTLQKNNYTSPFKSVTIQQLKPLTNYSQSKLSKDLNALTTASYVLRGIKKSRAETFYITQKGIDLLNQLFNEVTVNE